MSKKIMSHLLQRLLQILSKLITIICVNLEF